MKIKNILKLIPCFYFPLIVFLFSLILHHGFNAYDIFSWIDIPMHFIGGASIAYASILVLRKVRREVVIKDRFFEVLIVLGFVCIVAVVWEFYEFLIDYFFSLNWQLSLEDTMADFFFGLTGGLSIAVFRKV